MDEVPPWKHGTTRIVIPPRLLNRYITLFNEAFPRSGLPEEPERSLRRLLMRSRRISGTYYANGRWILDADDADLRHVFIAPSVTDHAKQRLIERFGVHLECEDAIIRLGIKLAHAAPLSQRERHRCRIGGDVKAFASEGRIYILREHHVLVTVLAPDDPAY